MNEPGSFMGARTGRYGRAGQKNSSMAELTRRLKFQGVTQYHSQRDAFIDGIIRLLPRRFFMFLKKIA
jgi:hypothetical protein